MEDLAHLERLKSYEHQILRRNEEETKKKNALRQEYLDLKKKLLSLSDTTRQNVMVPQGKVAYFPGELIHTNEILVLLGDNWFVERSGKQSAEIVQRRIKVIEEQLEQLKKEQENLKSYLKYTNSFADKPEDYKEIKEELPDSKPSKSGKRLAHKSTHSNVPKPVTFDKLKENGKSTFSHEQLFARLNELEEQELEDERKANEEKIRAIQDGEYEPSKISRNVDIDSDDDSDCEGETTNINFHHSSNRVISGQTQPASSEQSYAINSPRDIYERFERHMRKNSNDNNNNVRETFRPSHRNSSDAVKRSRSTEEVRRRTHSDGSVQSPPNQSILKTTASKPLKSILKSSSRSNSNENLVPRPILKHSPEHQRSPPDVESVADSVSAVVINEINSRAGVRETDTTIPNREGILKDRESGTSTPSEEMSEDLRSILKMNPTEVDISKPILKSTNDFDERPNTPEVNEMKPILKHTTSEEESEASRSILKSTQPPVNAWPAMVTHPDALRTILKSPEQEGGTSRPPDQRNVSFQEHEEVRIIDSQVETAHVRNLNGDQAFSGVVVERDISLPTEQEAVPVSSNTKPVSRFKANRKK